MEDEIIKFYNNTILKNTDNSFNDESDCYHKFLLSLKEFAKQIDEPNLSNKFTILANNVLKYRQSKIPYEVLDIQNKLVKWTEDGLNDYEVDNKLKEIIGEPLQYKIVEDNGKVFEEKIWNIGDGTMSTYRQLSDEEIDEYLGESNNLSYGVVFEQNMDSIIKDLEEEQKQAIKKENYEDASKIRDKIIEIREENIKLNAL